MKPKNLIILKTQSCNSINEFVNHWQKFYDYKDADRYAANVKVTKFSASNLRELYRWKNGMTLDGSGSKEKALEEKIVSRKILINKFKASTKIDLAEFNDAFENVSPVWRIFLLHIIKPKKYPMYDQHVHRAYLFIHGLDWSGINNKMPNKEKLAFYFGTYLPYVQSLKYKKLKAFDEAFFAFGQYLNTRKQGENILL